MAKRITFDPKIIETLHTRVRQFTNDCLKEFERMAYSGWKETRVIEQLGERKAHSKYYRGYNLVSERALKNLSISIFIKVYQHPCKDPGDTTYYHDEQ